jgi:subtilisin family serine protease
MRGFSMRNKRSFTYLILTISVLTAYQFVITPEFTSGLSAQNGIEFDWHLEKISAFDAWKITNGSSDVVIAVIDSGICFNHSEITHAEWINTDEIVGNAIDDDANGYIDDVAGWDFVSIGETPDNEPEGEPGDQVHWHATFIAGLISAAIDGDGIAGIASNVTLMNLRVLKADNYAGCSYEELGDSIRYAVDNGADIISMSLQNYPDTMDYYDDIQYAYNNNVSLVSCTGNRWLASGGGYYYQSYPGGYSEVISVGATNYYDVKADYSNYGPWTELVAPVGDQNYDIIQHLIHSTYNNGTDYVYGIGTSFACPQVSAAIALMISANSSVTSSEIREILQKTATDLGTAGKDDQYGYGMLNVTAAVMEAVERGSVIPDEIPTSLTPTNTSTNGSLGFTALIVFISISAYTIVTMVLIRKRK